MTDNFLMLLAFRVNRSSSKLSLQTQVFSTGVFMHWTLQHKSIHNPPWLAIYDNHARFHPCSVSEVKKMGVHGFWSTALYVPPSESENLLKTTPKWLIFTLFEGLFSVAT